MFLQFFQVIFWLSICVYVPKYLTNRWIYIAFGFIEASSRSWKDIYFFGLGAFNFLRETATKNFQEIFLITTKYLWFCDNTHIFGENDISQYIGETKEYVL